MPDVSTIALCWRVERSDGAGIALTSHDAELVRDGIAYLPTPGVTPAAIVRSVGLDPVSSEVSGVLSAQALTEQDLALGRWNGAKVTLQAVSWDDPATPPTTIVGGELGEVSMSGNGFSAELNGAAAKLEQPVCPATSPECRAELGDERCRVDLAGRTIFAEVIESSEAGLRLNRAVGTEFLLGRLRYRSGANCGVATTIVAVNGEAVRIRDFPRAAVEVGCRVELREGCDKRLDTCALRFGNAANFRGEPHLPGNDLLTRYPGA